MLLLYAVFVALISSTLSSDIVLLQATWRHGDRTPTYTCKGDPNKEEPWLRYGGYGQLTPNGMNQHVGLGNLMYQKYAVEEGFLSNTYIPSEIYVRSTDVNRTMISAIANMIGMYSKRNTAIPGEQFPTNVKWPPMFVPVPIHTVRNFDDYVVNPDAACPRQSWLWQQVTKTPEWRNLIETNKVFLDRVSAICQERVDPADDLWKIKDAFKVESIYNLTLPVDDEMYEKILQINNEIENMQNGMDIQVFNGIDFRVEIGKIRGGGLLWDMIRHIDLKIHCLEPTNVNHDECNWMKKLKYYAYSAHDTTVGALLAVLKAKEKIITVGGYPEYSSAVVVELHHNTSGYCLKFLFHRDFKSEFEDITSAVEGCENTTCCPYPSFREHYKKFYPSNNEIALCQDLKSLVTYFDPDLPNNVPESNQESGFHNRLERLVLNAPETPSSTPNLSPALALSFASILTWTLAKLL